MKKITLFIAAAMLLLGSVNAQKSMFDKGDQLFKVGLGYTAVGYPLELSYEKGFKEDVGGIKGLNLALGGYFAYLGYSEDFVYGYGADSEKYSWNYTYLIIGARAIGHYQFIDNFDTYFGVMLGYNKASFKFEGSPELERYVSSTEVGGFTYSGVAGVRYEFNPKMGVYLEAGYGVANVTAGLAIKF